MRVVLAEDLFLLRDGLVRLLEAHDFEIAAAVETGPELSRALAELEPDVAVVDVRLPPTLTDEGLQCALEARRKRPGLPVLVLSQHVEQLYARELLADGSGGVGVPAQGPGLRRGAVRGRRTAGRGGRCGDGSAGHPATAHPACGGGPAAGTADARELEVLELMAQGRTNAAIAGKLVVTERAIAKHTANIFAKLSLEVSDDDNRRVLAVLAYLDRGR